MCSFLGYLYLSKELQHFCFFLIPWTRYGKVRAGKMEDKVKNAYFNITHFLISEFRESFAFLFFSIQQILQSCPTYHLLSCEKVDCLQHWLNFTLSERGTEKQNLQKKLKWYPSLPTFFSALFIRVYRDTYCWMIKLHVHLLCIFKWMRDALCISLSLLSSTENESIQKNNTGFTFFSPAVKSKIAPLCKQPTWRVYHWTQSLQGIKAHTTITDLHHGKQMHALNVISNHRANNTSRLIKGYILICISRMKRQLLPPPSSSLFKQQIK